MEKLVKQIINRPANKLSSMKWPKNLLFKLLSLFFAVFLWYFVAGEDRVDTNIYVPVEIVNLPRNMVISNQYKKQLEVTISGPRGLVNGINRQHISRTINLSKAKPGTTVVVQGPRFSTRAESRWFAAQGWTVVNMTQYPEVTLANEARIPYVSLALITDYDAGLEDDPDVTSVTQDEVFAVFRQNVEMVRRVLFRAITAVPEDLLAR